MLKEFSVDTRWWLDLWGGGHTVDTDPTRQGWRARPAKAGSKVLIIGRRGVAGAASVMQLSGGQLDVAIYGDQTPEAVAKAMDIKPSDREGSLADPIFPVVPSTPGWGLRVLELILSDQ